MRILDGQLRHTQAVSSFDAADTFQQLRAATSLWGLTFSAGHGYACDRLEVGFNSPESISSIFPKRKSILAFSYFIAEL